MKKEVLDLHEQGFKNIEICEIFNLTKGKVAGIIYRYKLGLKGKLNAPAPKKAIGQTI